MNDSETGKVPPRSNSSILEKRGIPLGCKESLNDGAKRPPREHDVKDGKVAVSSHAFAAFAKWISLMLSHGLLLESK